MLHSLTQQLCSFKDKDIWVAYSGGVDSHVLLHLLANAEYDPKKLHAIHIDHNLHSNSALWAQHCALVARELGITFSSIKVSVDNIDKLGLEAAARTARYAAFKKHLTANDVLLTAQHQQDQAETLLLQLFRGAGAKGLSSMAKQFQLGNVSVARPLIDIRQDELLAYAKQHNLKWVEDPSNSETRWNRNYIRHNILPEIEKRWPSVAKTISRSAENCAEADELLTELAQQDLISIGANSASEHLSISKLLALSPARCRNLIRYFVELKNLATPSSMVLQAVIDEVCLAKQDSTPMIAYADVEIRRFQDKLYFMSPLLEHDTSQIIECNSVANLTINDRATLVWQQTKGEGLTAEIIAAGITVRFRQGGEQIQLPKHTHHKSLKNLFQEWDVPPWQRARVPLIFSGETLVAIAGYTVDSKYSVAQGGKGYYPEIKME